jgi:hypothetical protein
MLIGNFMLPCELMAELEENRDEKNGFDEDEKSVRWGQTRKPATKISVWGDRPCDRRLDDIG